MTHLGEGGATLFQCQSGIIQEAGIQKVIFVDIVFVAGLFRNGFYNKFFKQGNKGEENNGSCSVKNSVHNGNAHAGGRCRHEFKADGSIQNVEGDHQQNSTGNVEIGIDQSCALTVYIGADSGNKNGSACADAHTDNHGNGHIIADNTGNRKCLQNTDGSRAALNDGSYNKTNQKRNGRIGNGSDKFNKSGVFLQRSHSAAHRLHAAHKNSEGQQDHTDILRAGFLAEEIENNANKSQESKNSRRRDGSLALNACQYQNPTGNGGADIGTHDNADGIGQLHDAGINKTDYHNCGGRGGLDCCGDQSAQKHTFKSSGSQLAEDDLQLAAGNTLKTFAHKGHTEEEEGKTAQQSNRICNTHICRSFLYQDFRQIGPKQNQYNDTTYLWKFVEKFL